MTIHQPELHRQAANYAAVRARLMGRGKIVNLVKRQPQVIEPAKQQEPVPEGPQEDHDAHIQAYADYLAKLAECTTAGAYVRLRCKVLGLPYDAIMSESRIRAVVDARFQMIWEVRARFPHLSSVQIGIIFRRDHSSIIPALKKGGCRTHMVKISPDQVEEMVRLRSEGMTHRAIACRMGVCQASVSRYLKGKA